MYILGLTLGHNATACLLKDGEIIGCVSEERFSRIKNHCGVPIRAINYLIKDNKIRVKDIDLIVVVNDAVLGIKEDGFSKNVLNSYKNKSLKRKVLGAILYKFPKIYERYLDFKEKNSKDLIRNSEEIKDKISKILFFPREKIITSGHHLAHAFATCFNLPKNKKTLIFTLDAEGDNTTCASVNIFDGKNIKVISKSRKNASLGYLYAVTTIFLGMKPLEHEFKVMGLAPYAKEYAINEIYPKLKKIIWVDDSLQFNSKFSMALSDYFFLNDLKFVRFDTIAGAVQKLVEELTCEWVKKAVKKTGINSIALSGGVFMNVKANQKIAELPEVENIFIMPSSSDESNAIGACFYGYKEYCERNNEIFNPKAIQNLYLGPEYDNEYIENLIKEKNLNNSYIIKKFKDINSEIAKLLARGEIVARCSGKSEWGARALGNRSILANPKNTEIIRVLNEAVKNRDFWMPFTPSILDEDEQKYIINKKKIKAPYMVITFDSTEKAKKDIIAAIHPYDFTVRPQIVYRAWNPEYYDLIKKFKNLTGIGAVLNTSFNLHGEPIVLSPEDAIYTLENSSLNYLVLGNYLLKKRS